MKLFNFKSSKNKKSILVKLKPRHIRLSIIVILVIIISTKLFINKANLVKADTLFTFDEGYGTRTNDANSTVTAGTISNAAWKADEYCVYGKCLYFEGTADYVTYADNAALDMAAVDTVTIEGWFRTSEITSGTRTLVSKYETVGADGGYKVTMNSTGQISFGIDSNNTSFPLYSVTSTPVYDDSKWHHFAAVKNGTTSISLYIDGTSAGTTAITSTDASDNDSMFVGRDESNTSNDWLGYLDEIKVLRTARSSDEVKTDVVGGTGSRGSNASFGGSKSFLTNGLMGYWKLESDVIDYSGNSNTLTNNGTTTYAAGRYGNGSEHVPASSQYLNLSGTSTATYYFDSSDAAVSDPQGAWASPENIFDSDINTSSNTNATGSDVTNYAKGEGTNAPGTGDTITAVQVRIYGYGVDNRLEAVQINGLVYTDGLAETLGTATVLSATPVWGSYTTLSTPSGGWTWAKVQALEAKVYMTDQPTFSPQVFPAKMEIQVTASSAATSINGIKTVSFWTNPDVSTNYYISLNASSYITSSSGTVTATGFTNPVIYVNGVLSSTVVVDKWQMVTVTFDSPIDASQFYIGRQGSNYFDGTMDEVRLYSSILGASEVSKLYQWGPGPVADWKLDQNSGGTSYDSSTNNHSLTNTSITNLIVTGKYGSASGTKVDGVLNGYYSLDINATTSDPLDFSNTQNFSYTFWYKARNAENTDISPFSKGAGTVSAAGYDWEATSSNSAACRYTDGDGAGIDTTSSTVAIWNDGLWHHIGCVMDRAGITNGTPGLYMYIDGVLAGSDTTLTEGSAATSTQDIQIGESNVNYEFDGAVDETKIYTYARTPTQVIEDMNGGHPSPGSPVGSAKAYWAMDDGYGTTAFDRSPSANNLTLSATAWTNTGKINKAWDGNGTKFLSRTNDNDFDVGTGDFSFAFWFKSDNIGGSGTQYIINRASNTIAGFAVYGNASGNIVFAVDDDTSWTPDATVVTTKMLYDQTWHHIIVVKNMTSRLDIYVDGSLNNTSSVSIPTGSLSNDLTFYLGDRDGTDNGDEFIGDLDEIKFYTSAFDATQVKIEFNMGNQSVMGAISTDASGNPSWSADREYCPPGNTDSNCAVGLDPSPVGQWKFDENSGATANDTGITGGTGTLTLGPKWTAGKVSSGLSFDNIDDYVTIADNANFDATTLEDMTISGWFNVTNVADDQTIISKTTDQTTAAGWNIYINDTDGKMVFKIADGTRYYTLTSASTFTSPGWHHFTVVWDQDSAPNTEIYIDGKADNAVDACTTACSITQIADTSNANPVVIGAESNLANYFNGTLDHIRIFKYAFNTAQVAWNYNKGAPTAWWRFDETSVTTTYDASGNGNNGTITSATHVTGKINNAMNFNTSNARVVVTDASSTDDNALEFGTHPFSVSLWVKYSTPSIQQYLMLKQNTAGGFGFNVQGSGAADPGVIRFGDTDSATYPKDSASTAHRYDDNNWHHVVGIRNTVTPFVSIYVDGILEATDTVVATTGSVSSPDDLYIGIKDSGLGGDFVGSLDDIQFFNYPLSTQQIKTLYNVGAAVRL